MVPIENQNTETALDWMQCTAIERDAERLACYDAIAAESAGRHISSNEPDTEKDMIILRCREEMGDYGWRMNRHCTDRDIAAECALRGIQNTQ